MVIPVAPTWALEGGLKSNFAGTLCASGGARVVVLFVEKQPLNRIIMAVLRINVLLFIKRILRLKNKYGGFLLRKNQE